MYEVRIENSFNTFRTLFTYSDRADAVESINILSSRGFDSQLVKAGEILAEKAGKEPMYPDMTDRIEEAGK